MEEQWKDIQGFEGLYKISNLGNVMSVSRIVKRGNHFMKLKQKLLKPHYDINSKEKRYPMVILCKNGKCYTKFIHKMVSEEFISNPQNLPCINHKDENILNNSVCNLEWCSYSYNNSYNDLAKYKGLAKRIPILQFTKDGKFIREWSHAGEASNSLGISKRAIYECCKGRSKTSAGYIWKRKENK